MNGEKSLKKLRVKRLSAKRISLMISQREWESKKKEQSCTESARKKKDKSKGNNSPSQSLTGVLNENKKVAKK